MGRNARRCGDDERARARVDPELPLIDRVEIRPRKYSTRQLRNYPSCSALSQPHNALQVPYPRQEEVIWTHCSGSATSSGSRSFAAGFVVSLFWVSQILRVAFLACGALISHGYTVVYAKANADQGIAAPSWPISAFTGGGGT